MISNVAQSITRSAIRRMYDMAFEYKDTISFTVGEPDFVTPQNIIDVACEHLKLGETHYTPNSGINPLKEAIARKFSKEIHPIDPVTEVVVTCGASEALLLVMQAVLNPGDEVLLCNPYWTSYMGQIKIVNAVPKFIHVKEEDGFVLDCDELERNITSKSKLLILNSPSNPTGSVVELEALKRIAQIAIKHNLIVISDEVYKKIIYDDIQYVSIASLPGMAERTIVVDSFSKSYAMTGWRLGFAFGPKEIIREMVKIHEASVSCISSPYQYAGVEALENSDHCIAEIVEKFRVRRELITKGINRIKGLSCKPPKGAFYLFVNIKELGIPSEQFAVELLKKTGVVLVPGAGFGVSGEGYIRMSFATNEQNITEGLNRIDSFVNSL